MKLYEEVELTEDLPDDGLCAGQTGTIVEVYEGAYEVEFNDPGCGLIAFLALRPDQIRSRPSDADAGHIGE